MRAPYYLISFVEEWLTGRTMTVKHRNKLSAEIELHNGIPQGSSLSVLLWLIYVNDIPLENQTTNIFVDDTLIWAEGKDDEEVIQKLQSQTNELITWCEKNQVIINPNKTQLIMNRYQPHARNSSIQINNQIIRASQTMRYLGVKFVSPPGLKFHILPDFGEIKEDIQK